MRESTVAVSMDVQDPSDGMPERILVTNIELHTMRRLPGGVCFENWCRLRGLDSTGAPLPREES